MKFLFIVLLLLWPGLSSAAIKPRLLHVFIGGHSGDSYEVIYDGRVLRYYKAGDMHELKTVAPREIAIRLDRWGKLLSSLDDLRVWEWERRYVNDEVADGLSWSCVIVYDTIKDRSVICYGSNQAPEGFADFAAIIGCLVEDPQFGAPLPSKLNQTQAERNTKLTGARRLLLGRRHR